MDVIVLWGRLLALIAPRYPKVRPKGARPPILLKTMLRVDFRQNWCALSDPMAEETLYDSEAMRRFAWIELGDDRIPDVDPAGQQSLLRCMKNCLRGIDDVKLLF